MMTKLAVPLLTVFCMSIQVVGQTFDWANMRNLTDEHGPVKLVPTGRLSSTGHGATMARVLAPASPQFQTRQSS
jgi:hypothetical protein